MTSDLEATTDDLYATIRRLWQDAQGGGDDLPVGGYGQRMASVPDTNIATAMALDLEVVREYLDNVGGVKLVVDRDDETRSVKGLLSPGSEPRRRGAPGRAALQ
jgi:hypothetical protein